MKSIQSHIGVIFLCLSVACSGWAATGTGPEEQALYKQYTDPQRRFILDYPATMKVRSPSPDEVQFYHPGASFRISVFVEKSRAKPRLRAEDLVAALTKELKDQMKAVTVLGEGKLVGLEGSQRYVMISYKDAKGRDRVDLVQYYVTENRILQLTISDSPVGFKNLEPVIRRIHHSLRIIDPQLNE
jgi:hypothetical protein